MVLTDKHDMKMSKATLQSIVVIYNPEPIQIARKVRIQKEQHSITLTFVLSYCEQGTKRKYGECVILQVISDVS